MAKPRATTIQQRFGFKDSDLKTPLHDEILLWLDENIQIVIKELLGWNPTWESRKVDACKAEMIKNSNDLSSKYPMPEKPEKANSSRAYLKSQYDVNKKQYDIASARSMPEISSKKPDIKIQTKWEFPISTQSRNKFVIGFIDMYVQATYATSLRCVLREYHVSETYMGHSIKLPVYDVNCEHEVFYFEIKTTIPSLGELVRQIRFYQEYTQYTPGKFIIVCPDDRFKKPLASQGIGFVKYPTQNQQASLL